MNATTPWRELVGFVHAWAARRLPQNTRSGSPNRERLFVVNDALWGSVRMTSLERAIVDTPLVQRLRRIRQLGPAALVYPSASHSRFEHSVGALHRAATVMEALVASASVRPETGLLVPKEDLINWTPAVRLGALLHDVGHTFCSHAGERSVTAYGVPGLFEQDVEPLVHDAARDLDCEKLITLSELLSFAIISSDAMATFCARYDFRKDDLALIAGATVRSRHHVPPCNRWIADLLSGPLDVDKQDYVPRDAMMAGVGVQVEPHRCAEVLRVCNFASAKVINDPSAEILPDERRMTITFAGISVLEDLLLSRMSLFLRLYRHHKVRLVERLLERAYELVVATRVLERLSSHDLSGMMDLCDSAFFDGELRRCADRRRAEVEANAARCGERQRHGEPSEARAAREQRSALESEAHSLRLLAEVLLMLEQRELPIRAFAYGQRFPDADLPFHRKSASDAWDQICQVVYKGESRKRLETEIVADAIKLAKLIGEPLSGDEEVTLRAATFVDLPQVTNIDVTPLLIYPRPSGRSLLAYDKLFQPSQWLDALQDSKLICYVYAPRPYGHIIHAAAEAVFARRFGAMAHELRKAYSRCSLAELEHLKETLSSKLEEARTQIEGVERILLPPSFVSKAIGAQANKLVELMEAADALIRQHQHLAAAFMQAYDADARTAVAVLVDIVGSSSYARELVGKGIDEATVRSGLLILLLEHTFHALAGKGFGILPLKSEGDAVVAIGAFEEAAEPAFVARAADCAHSDEWMRRLREFQKKKGWPERHLTLRITLSRGNVDWQSQLRDMLGASVTALFVTENEVKQRLKDANASVALLGEWNLSGAMELLVGEPSIITHEKISADGVEFRTVRRS